MKKNIAGVLSRCFVYMLMLLPLVVSADLPVPDETSDGEDKDSSFWDYVTSFIKMLFTFGPLVLSAATTLWVGWNLVIAINNERQQDKPDWGSVGVKAAGGVACLSFTAYLALRATSIWA